jgi:acetylornithine deacetylase
LLLHGCGACDVKGSLACFLAAIDGIARVETRPDVVLMLTADEEIGCKGMERLLAATKLRIRSAIVSEPTSLRPGIAGKGYGLARVTIHGVEAHSAFPAEGVSAIVLASQFIAGLENVELRGGADKDGLFQPPHTTLNVGIIQGGSAKNIVAGKCMFLVEWRPTPSDAPRRVFRQLESLAAEMQRTNHRVRIDVELLRAEEGFAAAASGPLRERLSKIASTTSDPEGVPVGISFGSEASRIARVADEVIVIGPGDMRTAHSERECVPVAELKDWTATLCELLTRDS